MTCSCCNEPLRAHRDWWLKNDHGDPILFQGTLEDCANASVPPAVNCAPYVDWTVPEAREWWMHQPLREVCGPESDAKLLVDGMMMDGAMYNNPQPANLSTARYDQQFAAKMIMLA